MAEIVTLPGIKGSFAVGLTWWPERDMPGRRDLRARSLDLSARWGTVRKSPGLIQTGFCAPIAAAKTPTGLHPLAAIVADAYPQPWMGLYQLGRDRDCYWLIAVRDGHAVIAEGDVVGTLAQAERIRARHRDFDDWTEYEGGLEELAQIVRASPTRPTLKDVQASPWRAVGVAGIAVSVVALTAGGFGVWRHHKLEIERQAALARQRAIVAALAAKPKAPKIQPWTREPMPSEVLAACAPVWHRQELASKGWLLSSWHCKATMQGISVEGAWIADGGSAADAPGVLSSDGRSSNSISASAVAFSRPTGFAEDDASSRRAAWALAQTRGYSLKLQVAATTAGLPGGVGATDTPLDPWLGVAAEFATAGPPWLDGMNVFDSVPGLRITDVTYDANKDQWFAAGTLYTLRPLVDGLAHPRVEHPAPTIDKDTRAPKGGSHAST